jgi:hypothetical membrane protein
MFSHSDIQRHAEDLDFCRKLNRYLSYLLGLILLVLTLGILSYNEKFLFWEHALSYLGAMQTECGNPNGTSLIVFGLGMIFCSLICFKISRLICENSGKYLFMTCGGGFVLMIVPCDLFNPVHAIGAGMVVATLWLFTILLLNELSAIYKYRIYLYHLILHGTVLPYAYLYFFDSPFQQAAQKVALFGLILILKIAVLEHLHAAQSFSGQGRKATDS